MLGDKMLNRSSSLHVNSALSSPLSHAKLSPQNSLGVGAPMLTRENSYHNKRRLDDDDGPAVNNSPYHESLSAKSSVNDTYQPG